jgi:hypothetical protein
MANILSNEGPLFYRQNWGGQGRHNILNLLPQVTFLLYNWGLDGK